MGTDEPEIIPFPAGRSDAEPGIRSGNDEMSILPMEAEHLNLVIDGRVLVNDVSFRLEARRKTIVLGPNGAGKSLLLRLCHGLIEPSSGTVTWQGAGAAFADPPQMAGADLEARRVAWQAMVFQRPVTLRRSVKANIDYALRLHRIERREADRRCAMALKRTGLERLADQAARTLSGGEQQRLALARAWALRPEVLFLDEPTANLDPASTNQVEGIVNRMHHDNAKIIMTTHDIAQAQRLADEVLFLYRGRIFEHTPAEEFFNRPRTDEARAFLGGRLLG